MNTVYVKIDLHPYYSFTIYQRFLYEFCRAARGGNFRLQIDTFEV